MPLKVGVGYVDILPDMRSFSRDLKAGLSKDLSSAGDTAAKSLKQSFAGAAKGIAAGFAGLAVGNFFKGAVSDASELNEAVNVTAITFKGASGDIDRFVRSSTQIGLSEAAARKLTASLGGLLHNMGLSSAETVDWSKKLTRLGSDLGSAFDADPAQAIEAIGSALRGETEPIRRFNVVLDDAAVKQKAVSLGLASSTATVDKHAKAQATLALIYEQTSDSQGDFARTSDSLANRQRQLDASFTNLKATLGGALLPAANAAAGAMNGVLGVFEDLPGPLQSGATGLVIAAAGLTTAGLAAGLLVPKLRVARAELASMGPAGARANTAIGLLGKAVGGLAVVGGVIGLMQTFRRTLDDNTAAIGRLSGAVDKELVAVFGHITTGGLQTERTALQLEVFREVAEANLGTAQRTVAALKAQGEDTSAYEKILGQVSSAQKQANKDQAEGAKTLGDLAGTTGIATDALDNLRSVLWSTTDAQEAQADAARAVIVAERGLIEAKKTLNDLIKDGAVDEERVADARERLSDATRSAAHADRDLAKAQKEYNEAAFLFAEFGLDSAQEKLGEATDNLADAQDTATEAHEDAANAQRDLKAAQAGDPEFQDKLADARRGVADATEGVADANDNLARRTYDAITATGLQTTALAGQTDQAKLLLAELNRLNTLHPELAGILGPEIAKLAPPSTAIGGSPLVPQAAPGGLLGPLPSSPTALPAGLATTNVKVDMTVLGPAPDPALLSKAIAWVI